jgi:hypothetical protein
MLTFILATQCTYDSEEALNLEIQLRDSLANKIPEISILAPLENDTVIAPFTILYNLKNWNVNPGSFHLQYFIDLENQAIHYGISSLIIENIEPGSKEIRLQLALPNFRLVNVYDAVNVVVKAPPAGTFTLLVEDGTGSGNYDAGKLVIIEALERDGKIFNGWSGDIQYVDNPAENITQVRMPEREVKIKASFSEKPVEFGIMVAPVIQENCLSCHSGLYEPNLSGCENVRRNAASVAAKIIDSRDPMPPEGLMSQDKISIIQDWIRQGSVCN